MGLHTGFRPAEEDLPPLLTVRSTRILLRRSCRCQKLTGTNVLIKALGYNSPMAGARTHSQNKCPSRAAARQFGHAREDLGAARGHTFGLRLRRRVPVWTRPLVDEHSTVEPAEVCFFADAGDGSWFGFVPKREAQGLHDIYVWGPVEGSWTWVAPDLERFVRGWLSGDIAV